MNKIKSWIFRENLELSKKWWHRFIKVIFFGIFLVCVLSTAIFWLLEPIPELLGKYNSTIEFAHDNQYSTAEDKQRIVTEMLKIGIKNDYKLSKQQVKIILDNIPENLNKEAFLDTLIMKDYELEGVDTAQAKQDIEKKRSQIIPSKISKEFEKDGWYLKDGIYYYPNFLYYIEVLLIITLGSFVIFIISALIYYWGLLYVVYGKK